VTKTAPVGSSVLEVVPPSLHGGQLEVLNDPARFKLLRAGRRWRKSGLGVVQAYTGYGGDRFLGALTGGQIGWWVPSLTARYLVADWMPIRTLAQQIPGSRIEEARHRVVMPTGGSIMMLSADNIDSGRGLGLDGAVLDEASLMPEELWTETIRATLIDRQGWAMFLFTPKGLNWMHALSQQAAALPDWREFHYRSADNPYLKPEELEALTADMSTLVIRQEIDAEYVTGGAGMFYRDWFRYWWPGQDGSGHGLYHLGEGATILAEHCRRFTTVDLAWSLEERADYTVISTWAVTPQRHLILLDVVREHIAGPDIVRKMRSVYERLSPGYFLVERATKQLSIIQDAERAGLPIREIRAEKDKQARALPATARVEHGQVWFPRASAVPAMHECEAELVAFPMGQHDDFVDTLSYAVLEVASSRRAAGFAGGRRG
jgi:predicted phage terminase large subunit-like protein